jgi:hypothetical protein
MQRCSFSVKRMGATRGDVRVYLVGYILCIIDCHICWDIFGKIDIIYYKLAYISRCALPLKTLILYIYQSRGTTMQCNTTNNYTQSILPIGGKGSAYQVCCSIPADLHDECI